MNEHASELIGLVGVLFFMLVGVLVWIGQRVHQRLDHLSDVVGEKFDNLHDILAMTERRHNDKIVDIERRVIVIEQRCNHHH